MPYLEWAHEAETKTPEDTFRFLDRMQNEWDEGNKFDFGIFVDNVFVGRIGFFNVSIQHKSCEFGYWLDKDMTGRGIITKCVQALEKLLFGKLGFNRIVIRCDKRNLASAGVAKRCGYTQEAEFKQDRVRKYETGFSTTLVFAKVKGEN